MRSARSLLVALALLAPVAVRAQQPDTTVFYRAMDLESDSKFREAAVLYRQALRTPARVNALLGLERVYAELGWTDSLFVPLDSLIAQWPQEPVYRGALLRAYAMTGRDAELPRAFEAWTQAMPKSSEPYREYARLLLQRGRPAGADSIIAQARVRLGTTADLQLELAQSRAATGQWIPSAVAWRSALAGMPDLDQAAAFSLAPAPEDARIGIRQTFLAPPVDVGARRALAALEMNWGSPADGWHALRELSPDSAAAAAWLDFAQRCEADERWSLARDALVAALKWRPSPDLALRAATAALNAGDPETALSVAPEGGVDSARAAMTVLPLRVRALSAYGRPADAEHLVAAYSRVLTPSGRAALERYVAFGWVRAGDLARAKAALQQAGSNPDSSDAAGWIALFEGDLRSARALLRTTSDATPELAFAMALMARTQGDTAVAVGQAFLALARRDSSGAARAFQHAAAAHADAASMLLGEAAQIQSALRKEHEAIAIWQRILQEFADSPEAPAADLGWARASQRLGDASTAVARLEHLILTYPQSALVPQARRELDLARRSIPGAG